VQYTEDYGVSTVTDDFESGTLGPEYTTGGNRPWVVVTDDSHAGAYSARAGYIDHEQQSWLKRSAAGGNLSFWYRVSSEAGYDFFRFYVDGDEQFSDSGNGTWTYHSQTLSAGPHELEWRYIKDDSVSRYDDTVYIDDLELQDDQTVWSDIIALTDPGATSTPWTPVNLGTEYKVRVRAHYGSGIYGAWDDSDATFTVVPGGADGDYEPDGDVDLVDYKAFQECFNQPATGPCGDAFEFVLNGTIDLDDYAAFVAEMTGP
jgi:hypothetical protein